MDSLNSNSVENLPGLNTKAVFKVKSSSVFKEDVDIMPTIVDDSLSYVPVGGNNQYAKMLRTISKHFRSLVHTVMFKCTYRLKTP